MRNRIVVGILLLLLAGCMAAQEITGTIVGTVKDSTGAVVANATVTVTNTDKNIVVRTITTDQSGSFVATLLPIGHYSVAVEAAGFKRAVRSKIELNVSDRLTENFSLEVGSTGQSITVEANPSQVELQSPTASGLISGVEIRQLSLNNRNYEQMVSLMPGVTSGASDQLYIGTTNPAGQANVVSFSINGARNSANNWTVDGADNVDRGSNLTLMNYPSIDAIAEFKVLRGLYSAEFGRGAGQINVVTRSGGSQFHGSGYEFWRNDALNANDYWRKRGTNVFNATHPAPLRYHDFGYTIGGPVYIPGVYNEKKDKTFFFFSQEFRRVITYSTFSGIALPTANEKAGTMPYDTCLTYSGTTCTQVLPANTPITNMQAINPVAAAYLKDVWSKAPAPDNPVSNLSTLSFRNQFNARQELVRIDHVFSPKLAIFGRFLNDSIPTQEPLGLFGPNTYIPGVANSTTNSPGKSWVFRATASLTPSMLLDGGYNYSQSAILSTNQGTINPANSPDVAAATKNIMAYPVTLDRIPSVTGVMTSIAGYGPYQEHNRDHNIFGNLSWIKGKHNFKFGATFHKYSKTENNAGANAGSFAFNSTGAIIPTGTSTTVASYIRNAQAWTNFLTGKVATFTQAAADLTPYIRMNQWEAYAQDEWRVTNRLTLSYGVRYSYFPQPNNDNNNVLSNFDPATYSASQAPLINAATGNIVVNAQGNPTQGNPYNGLIYASGPLKNSPYGNLVGENAKTNFAPRIGLAWDPWGDGKTSIRAGYGMFYQATLVGTYEQAMFTNPPYSATISIPNTSFSAPTSGVPSISAAPKTLRGVQTSGNTPYTQQWSLDLQRQFPMNFILDIGYYGSKDTHLLGIVDLNQPQPGAYVTAGISNVPLTSSNVTRINAIRPYLGYGPINAIVPWFDANYNSLQASLEKRFSSASLVKINYTWSHSLTDSMSDRSNAPANTYDLRQNYGPSALDRRHVVTASYVYELPFMKDQKGFTGHILGGWQTSGIVSIATGVPFNVSGNVAPTGGSSQDAAGQGCILGATACPIRPNEIGDPNNGPKTLKQWFNTSAFAFNGTPGQVGTARSGAIIGPGYWRVDMSIFKHVKFTEKLGMQLRLETFNVLNHENFNTINTTFGSSLFGQVTGSRDPRILQLGAKFEF